MMKDLGLIGVESRRLQPPEEKGPDRWATLNLRSDSTIDNAALGTYLRLFRHANYGEILEETAGKQVGYFAQVSENRLAELGECYPKTIRKHLKKLVAGGWITVAVKGMKGRPTVYRLPHKIKEGRK